MKNKNWIQYVPDEPKHGAGIMYLQDEEGNDWYDSYLKFKKKYKFTYETDTGIIRSVSEEAGMLYVSGLSVSDTDDLPVGFDIFGNWKYTGDNICPNVVALIKNAEVQRSNLLAEAERRITLLERAMRLGVASNAERNTLDALELYTITLSRLDISSAPAISWPAVPE